MNRFATSRSVSPVLGVILLVAVSVILSTTVAVFVMDQADSLQSTNTDAAVKVDEKAAGAQLTAVSVDDPLTVQYNGLEVHTLTDTGDTYTIPAAPGETITVIENSSGEETVVLSYEVKHSQDLVGYWNFDDATETHAPDESGLDNDAEMGNVTLTNDAVDGTAAYFDGTGWLVADITEPPNERLTVAFWMKPEQQQHKFTHPFTVGDGHQYTTYMMPDPDYGKQLKYKTYPGDDRTEGQFGNYERHVWQHIVMAYDGEEIRMYINGTRAETISASGPVEFSNGSIEFGGKTSYSSGEWFYGEMDELRLYNRGLTDAQVADLYEATKP